MSPILTITLNPSIDKTILVGRMTPGAEMRARVVYLVDGGKGVNVARALKNLGVPVTSLTIRDAYPAASIRVNTTVIDSKGGCTRFLEPGPCLSGKEWASVYRFMIDRCRNIKILALCGSLPPGAPVDIYARLISVARRKNIFSILDTSGEALANGIKAKPWGIKPNREEAEVFLGMSIRSVRAVRKALQLFTEYGITRVLLSLGEDGLAGSDGREMFWARVPYRRGITVGCGDVSLAGFLAAEVRGMSFREALGSGAAAGAVNVGAAVAGNINKSKCLAMNKKIKMEKI